MIWLARFGERMVNGLFMLAVVTAIIVQALSWFPVHAAEPGEAVAVKTLRADRCGNRICDIRRSKDESVYA